VQSDVQIALAYSGGYHCCAHTSRTSLTIQVTLPSLKPAACALCVLPRSRLATALLNLSSESVASMLVEDEASAARRASLTARKDMLEQAMKVMRAAV
jgi:hypothetical protein